MGMTIRSINPDGTMSPLCPVHPDGVVEDCETCVPWGDNDADDYDDEIPDEYGLTG